MARAAAAAAGEACHTIIPALPQEFERIATFRGYGVRSAELCFAWEGGQVTGRFDLAATWSNDDCNLRGSGQSTLAGTFSPKQVDDRIVGGALKGSASSGRVDITINGRCDDDKSKITNESQNLNTAGATWEGSVDNGILFVT
ncbi:MAG: hypothetical protein EXR52_00620, partial [Dehalococcoidia bacterium]|nr:hypothetical protein [Dehalococcoidia bacterium]